MSRIEFQECEFEAEHPWTIFFEVSIFLDNDTYNDPRDFKSLEFWGTGCECRYLSDKCIRLDGINKFLKRYFSKKKFYTDDGYDDQAVKEEFEKLKSEGEMVYYLKDKDFDY